LGPVYMVADLTRTWLPVSCFRSEGQAASGMLVRDGACYCQQVGKSSFRLRGVPEDHDCGKERPVFHSGGFCSDAERVRRAAEFSKDADAADLACSARGGL